MRRIGLLALAGVVLLVAPASGATAGETASPGRPRVLVLTLPDTTWSSFLAIPDGSVRSVAEQSAVASLAVRTADPVDTDVSAYLTLGAGRRATAADPEVAGSARQEVNGSVTSTDFAAQAELNARGRYGATAGALGTALAASDRRPAVVGDAGPPGTTEQRAVALATADGSGTTPVGRVDGLVVAEPLAPGGSRLDEDAVVAATGDALASADLVVVELSDVRRAVEAGSDVTAVASATERTDRLVGRLVELATPSDTVLLVSPTTPGEVRQLGVFALRGPGVVPGWAQSATTRRAGYVALEDVAATLLGTLGVPVPDTVGDTPVSSVEGTPVGARLAALDRASERAEARDRAVGPVAVSLVLLAILSGLVAVVLLRIGRDASATHRWLACTTCAVPVAAFLTGWWPGAAAGPTAITVVVLVGASVVGAVSVALTERTVPPSATLVPTGLTVAVLLLDAVTGGRLQLDTPLGYSATVGGRYSGLGNQASAYLVAATLAVLTLGWSLGLRRGVPPRRLLAGGAALGVVVAAVTAWPRFGSDVGGTVAVLVGVAVALALLVRPDATPWRLLLVFLGAGLVASALLGVLGWWDRSRPPEQRTHLGRFVDSVVAGDAPRVLSRRWAAATDVFTSTPWTLFVPVLLLALLLLAWRPGGRPWAVVERHPELAPFGASAAAAGAVGWLVNDSGVAVAACVVAVAVPVVAAVSVAPVRPGVAASTAGDRTTPVVVG